MLNKNKLSGPQLIKVGHLWKKSRKNFLNPAMIFFMYNVKKRVLRKQRLKFFLPCSVRHETTFKWL